MSAHLAILVSIALLAIGDEPAHKAKSATQWKAQTAVNFPVDERKEAIGALWWLAQYKMGWHGAPDDSPSAVWVRQEILPTLDELLDDNDAAVRAAAAYAFVEIGSAGKEAVPKLTKLLRDPDSSVRANTARAIGNMGESAKPAIEELVKLAHNDPDNRRSAAEALRSLGRVGLMPLVGLLNDPNDDVRKAAIADLEVWTKSTKTVLPSAIKLMHDKDAEIRRLSINAVFNIHPLPEETFLTVRELLQDPDRSIRAEIVRGLRHQKEARHFLPELTALITDKDAPVRAQLPLTLATPFLRFPLDLAAPSPGAQHDSIEEALEDSDADGTRSILDIQAIADEPDFCVAAPLDEATLESLYGTTQPTRQQIEKDMDFLEDVDRGHCVYAVAYKDGTPDEVLFAGYSFD